MKKWFTNAFASSTLYSLIEYAKEHHNVTVGEPKESKWISVEEMKKMGLVGLYEDADD